MKELPFSILGEAIQRVVKLSFSSSVVVGVKGINISQYYYELGFLLWGENNQVLLVRGGEFKTTCIFSVLFF